MIDRFTKAFGKPTTMVAHSEDHAEAMWILNQGVRLAVTQMWGVDTVTVTLIEDDGEDLDSVHVNGISLRHVIRGGW